MPKQNARAGAARRAGDRAACSPVPAAGLELRGAAHAGSHASSRNEASAVAHAPSCAPATVQPCAPRVASRSGRGRGARGDSEQKLASITANA